MKKIFIALACCFFIVASHRAVAQLNCGTPESGAGSGNTSDEVCSLNPGREVDLGNEFYIPHEDAEILEVNVNIWVFTHPLLYDGTAEPVSHFTSDPNHPDFENQYNYLAGLPALANERVYANGGLSEICNDGSQTTAPLSLDTRIRLVLNTKEDGNPAIYYVNDLSAATDTGNEAFNSFIGAHDQYDDAINIVFIQNDFAGWSGIAEGITSPDVTHIKINGGYNRYDTEQDNIEGQNFAHEFNHILGMRHTQIPSQLDLFGYECVYQCSDNDFDTPLNHNMSCGGQTQIYLSPLQAGYARRMLTTTFRSRFLRHQPVIKEVIEINEFTIITNPGLHWNGDIVINEGGILDVLSTLALTQDSRIFVKRGAKLIVDGGVITSCGEEAQWAGILVEGGFLKNGITQLSHPSNPTNASFAGTVWLKNEATISNARNAISTNNRHLGWPEVKSFWGGLIWCEGESRFEDCGRAVEIMKYGTQFNPDKSRFINTNFGRLNNGVTIWESDGVRFEGCHFEGIALSAIGPYNAQVIIENGNVFESARIGVDITGSVTKPYELKVGGRGTEPNVFEEAMIGIQAFNVYNSSHMVVENNVFPSSAFNDIGVFIFGLSKFNIRKNELGRAFNGVRLRSTSNVPDMESRISENEFIQSIHGVFIVRNNKSVNIVDNCFSPLFSNIFVTENGTLPIQGTTRADPTLEAGNCFGPGDDLVNENLGFDLEYLLMPGRPESACEVPKFPGGIPPNIQILDAESFNPDRLCGTNFTNDPPSGLGPCDTEGSLVELKGNVIELDTEIENFEGPAFMLREMKLCRADHLSEIFKRYIDDESYGAAAEYFSARPEFTYRTYAFSALMEAEDYVAARDFLETGVLANSFSENNFVEAQLIQLDYLENMLDYELSVDDYNFLKYTSLDSEQYGGAMASIFKFITGEDVEFPEWPQNEAGEGEEKSANDSESADSNGALSVYPNPVTGHELQIDYSQAISRLEIYNLQGQLLTTHNPNARYYTLDLKNLNSGTYILKVLSENEKPIQRKIIVLNNF